MSSQRLSAHLVSRGPSIMRHCILTWTAPAPITALLPFSPSPPTETPPISASPLFSAADGSAPSATGGTGGGGASGIAAVGKLGSSSISNGLPAAAAVLAWVAGGKAVLGGGAAIALVSFVLNEPELAPQLAHAQLAGARKAHPGFFLVRASERAPSEAHVNIPTIQFNSIMLYKKHSILLFCS